MGAWDGPALIAFLLIGMLTYIFARQALGSHFPALVAALTFAGGSYLASYPALDRSILGTVASLPLILGAVELGAERGWPGFVVAGVIWGLAASLGDPQTALYVGILALAYGGWRMSLPPSPLPSPLSPFPLPSSFFPLALALAVGLLMIGAMRLLGWGPSTLRTAVGYQQAASGLAPRALLQLILPGGLGPLSPLYVGILPLLLALVGLLVGNEQESRFWGAAALIALLLALGGNGPLYPLAYLAAPGFGLFHSQGRAALVVSFALALLAGYGAQALSGSLAPGSVDRLRGLACWAGLLGLGMLVLTMALSMGGVIPGLFLVGSVGLLSLRLRGEGGWLWQGLAVALILADLGLARWGSPLRYGPRADLGGQVAFPGYALHRATVAPGQGVELTVYWQSQRPMEVDYTVFTHLLDAEGRIRGQQDRMPVGGTRPTTTWLPGEIIADPYTIPLAPDAPPGRYRLEVGMYNLATGARLPVLGPDGVHVPQDRILLGTVDVTGP
jgi:hypothetical protein